MKLFLISIFTMVATGVVNAAPSSTVLKVKSYLKIDSGEKIYLHQLIDSATVPSESMKQLSLIVLGSAPALGEQRVFTNKAIAQALRSQASLKQVNLIIPNQVVVENRGFELSEEAVSNELTSRWKALCAECEINVRQLQLPILPVELKNQPWVIEGEARLPKGAFTQKLLVTQANGTKAIFWINGQMAIRKMVPVASHSLNFGQRIVESDFRWEWRDVTQASDGVPGEKQILGQKIRLPVQVGEILFAGSIEREKAVRRGEVVQVSTGDASGWQITLEAVTEQDGYVGDTVNVRNRQTNKVVSAQVTAPGKVVVQ
jgi:flagellar basal body P-ring formation protein FlgA